MFHMKRMWCASMVEGSNGRMRTETQLVLLVAFLASLWAVYGLRSGADNGEFGNTSVRCVKLNGNWHEPHGISPGWCGK